VTVDLRLQRAVITSRSIAARLRGLAAAAPTAEAAAALEEGAALLQDIAARLERRLEQVLMHEPSYPLARR